MWIIQIALFPLWTTSSAVMALQVWFSLTLTILLSSLKLLMLFMQCYQCDSAIHGIEGCDDRFDLSLFCNQSTNLLFKMKLSLLCRNFKFQNPQLRTQGRANKLPCRGVQRLLYCWKWDIQCSKYKGYTYNYFQLFNYSMLKEQRYTKNYFQQYLERNRQ